MVTALLSGRHVLVYFWVHVDKKSSILKVPLIIFLFRQLLWLFREFFTKTVSLTLFSLIIWNVLTICRVKKIWSATFCHDLLSYISNLHNCALDCFWKSFLKYNVSVKFKLNLQTFLEGWVVVTSTKSCSFFV